MKKRITSLVLALALIFGIFSCNAFAAQENANILNGFDLPEEFKMSISAYSFETDTEQDMTIYRKGDKLAMESELPIDDFGLSLKIKMIIKDGKGYVVFPQIPFIYISFNPDAYMDDMAVETEFISRNEEVIDGKNRVTERYKDANGNIIEYIYEDGKSVAAYSYDADGNCLARMDLNEISYSVSDWIFYVPFFAIDLNSINFYLD